MKLLLSVIGLALATLRENKIRSLLTVLGVVIGTGTIIAIGSILTGLDGAVTGAIRSLGTNNIIVMKMRFGPGFAGRTAEERNRKELTYENALAIAERCPSVEHVSPNLQPPGFGVHQVRYKGSDYTGIQLDGTDESYAVSQADMKVGRFFTDNESLRRMAVVVLGEDVYKSLFGVEDAIGKKITVDGHELEVIGVMNRPAASLPGQQDTRVMIPYFTMRKMFATANQMILMISAKPGMLPAAVDEDHLIGRG